MGQAITFPAVQQALDFINEKIATGEWSKGSFLPSVRALAQAAQVSQATVSKATKILSQKGLITTQERCRMRVGKFGAACALPVLPKWAEKRAILEKEIISGIFEPREKLPPLKELQARYGICFGTAKKILETLVHDGIVRPNGKGYSLPEFSAAANMQHIVFITCAGHFSQASALNHEHNRIINLLENECNRIGVLFTLIEIDFFDSMECHKAISKLPYGNDIAGYILDLWWYNAPIFRRSYMDVLTRLSDIGKPTAIIDETADFDLPVQFVLNPGLQVYRIEGRRAGERVAQYVLKRGHRSSVYIAPSHFARWSRERFEGVQSQFARITGSGNAHLIQSNLDVMLVYVFAASGLDDKKIKKIIAVGRTPSQAKDLERLWMNFKKGRAPMRGRTIPDIRGFKRSMAALAGTTRHGVEKDFFEKMCTGALSVAVDRVFGNELIALFKEALKIRDATAWICANDQTAFRAISFLKERGIRVPEDISVTGFDNIPVSALEQHLTTFDFNAMGFVYQMINFIVRPPRPRGHYRHQVIEVEGMLIERGTSGLRQENGG
jgi:DNA-binding LacI/PurR family transcriptional regulator/DNA-binding transcriptional regulator YhcF (GntR family)